MIANTTTPPTHHPTTTPIPSVPARARERVKIESNLPIHPSSGCASTPCTPTVQSSPSEHMTLEDAQKLHNDLIRREFSIQQDINELVSTPADCIEQSVLTQVNRELSSALSTLQFDIKRLKIYSSDLPLGEDREEFTAKVDRHKSEYSTLLKARRKAMFDCKEKMKAQLEHDRTELFGDNDALIMRRKRAQKNHMKTAVDISSSLKRSRRMMSSEVQRSAALLDALESSSATLSGVTKQNEQYHSTLGTGHRILSIMKRRDCTDWLLIGAGLLLFVLVVLYILKSRMASSPIFAIPYWFMQWIHWAMSTIIYGS